MDDLIYDRVLSDVENALNNPGNSSNLKGSYNYTDLNRVEKWCEYLKDILSKYGFAETLIIKTNWNMKDYPTRTQIDRIRHNIDKLKEYIDKREDYLLSQTKTQFGLSNAQMKEYFGD